MIYAVVGVVFLIVWAVMSGILLMAFNKEKPIEKLKYFDEDFASSEKFENKQKNKFSLLKFLSNLIPDFKFSKKKSKKLELELVKADMPITLEELLVVKLLSSSAVSFLAFAVFRDYFITALVFAVVWNIPRFIINKKKRERIKLFDSQLNEGITIISNSLKAGYSFLQAVSVVVDETKDPFSKEFKKLLKELSLGVSEEEAMKNLLNRVESEDLRLIVNAILIQKDIGGNLSEILDNISETIRERQKIKNELKTLTAQGRLSGYVVMLLPILLGIVIYLFNREYIMLLFTTPIGLTMICAAVVSQIFGFFLIRKIVDIEM